MIYEVIMYIVAIFTIFGFFGVSYGFNKILEESDSKKLANELEKFQEARDSIDKLDKPFSKMVMYVWYITIIIIGIVGGDLSLFFPCLISAVMVRGIRHLFKTKTLEIEEKILKGL